MEYDNDVCRVKNGDTLVVIGDLGASDKDRRVAAGGTPDRNIQTEMS